MVFLWQEQVGIAFTVGREETDGTLRQEEAERFALRELEQAGIPAPLAVKIEAFENSAGWLVFCTAERNNITEVYIQFDHPDDCLDAILAHGTAGISLLGWALPHSDCYIVRVSGARRRVAAYTALLGEYGSPFDAPPGYALHLQEQAD